MAELVGGAAVGAIFGELLKAVLEMKDKAIVFKQILSNLQATLEAIAPTIKEIEQHNNDLGRPKEELQRLIGQMEDGAKLVSKCSKINRLNFLKKTRYHGQLLELLTFLTRIEMQIQLARDQKETLLTVRTIRRDQKETSLTVRTIRRYQNETSLTVRRILSKVNKLPYGSSEDTRRSDSDLDVSDSESFHSAVSELSDNAAGFSRTNSTEQLLEEFTSLTLTQEGNQQKIVMKVYMNCDKCRYKVLKVAAEIQGVNYVALEGEYRDNVVVIGDGVDAIKLTSSLRKKVGQADIISLSSIG